MDWTGPALPVVPVVPVRLDVGADAAAAGEHVPHGDGTRQVGLAVVCEGDGDGQLQVLLLKLLLLLLLHAAVADPLAAVPQPIGLVVVVELQRLWRRQRLLQLLQLLKLLQLLLLGGDRRRRWLEVEGQLVVCAGRAEGLRARQFPGQGRGGEEGGAIGDGGRGGGGGGSADRGGGSSGGRRRHDVVVGVHRRQTRCDSKVGLLLLRLGLLLLTAVVLAEERRSVSQSRQRTKEEIPNLPTSLHP